MWTQNICSVFALKVAFSNLSGIVWTRPQIVPLWRAFSKSSVFVDLFIRISVDGSRIRNNKVAFSNLSGIVWTGPQYWRPVSVNNLFQACAKLKRYKSFTKYFSLYVRIINYLTTVFNFTRPLGIFHQEKTVFRLPSIIPYMVRRQNFSCRSKGFCVFKISVIIHNRYCVKCSLSYTADYTGTCPKSPVIFWLIRR